MIAQKEQVLQHFGYLKDRTALHLLEILAVPAHPVVVMLDFSILQDAIKLLDFRVTDDFAQTYRSDSLNRDHDQRVIRANPKIIKLYLLFAEIPDVDILNHREAVVRVDDFVAYFQFGGHKLMKE